jgi:hypothetical protein
VSRILSVGKSWRNHSFRVYDFVLVLIHETKTWNHQEVNLSLNGQAQILKLLETSTNPKTLFLQAFPQISHLRCINLISLNSRRKTLHISPRFGVGVLLTAVSATTSKRSHFTTLRCPLKVTHTLRIELVHRRFKVIIP